VRAHRAFQEDEAAGAEGLGGADDGARVAGVLDSVQHHHQRMAAEELIQVPGGGSNEGQHALRGLGSGDGLEQAVVEHEDAGAGETTDMAFHRRADRSGGQHRFDFAIAAQGLFEQMEGFGEAVAVVGTGAAGDGPADIFEQGVGGAGENLGPGHGSY